MDFDKLQAILDSYGEPTYRFRQIKLAVCRDLVESFDTISTIPLPLRRELDQALPFQELTLATEQRSKDGSRKRLFLARDGSAIESVLMEHEDGRRTVCVSTEAGCQINCSFCATGHLGFKRTLSAAEIVEQVLSFARELQGAGQKITNVVFMGMGEPFLNYDNVREAILLLNGQDGFNLGQRHISVSTSGIVPGIERFTGEDWQVNLAVSLHAPTNMLRTQLMPINQTFPLEMLMPVLDAYVEKTGRRLMIEYLLIGGINDASETAGQLADLLHSYPHIARLSIVNLILYNPTGDSYGHWARFKVPDEAAVQAFEEILTARKVAWTRRVSFGGDISGACGQLAGTADRRGRGRSGRSAGA